MRAGDYATKSHLYLKTLCGVKPNRRTGSAGNRQATRFFADTIHRYGYQIDATPFECLDYISRGAELTHDGEAFEVYVSPYSLGCNVVAELISVSTIEQLEGTNCEGKILLMVGAASSEQLLSLIHI